MEQHQAGSQLRAEVERQLLKDIEYYGVESKGLFFDWSHICSEGHGTWYLGDRLDNVSGLWILDKDGNVVAEGWIEFVHGGEDNPLFVFWEFLRINTPDIPRDAKIKSGIPEHIWNQLPDKSKYLCMKRGTYDARWCDDPRVMQWQDNNVPIVKNLNL
jgi:hypothetical protein